MEYKIMNIFITGSAGYVGRLLADSFSKKENVSSIICLDKESIPEILKNNPKVVWINANTSDNDWQEKVKEKSPEVIIHCAWQIRQMYGQEETQKKWNILGTDNVFDFAFENSFVKKLIYFSSAAVYGAREENSIDYFFNEQDPARENDYLYGKEKRISEEHLKEKYSNASHRPQVFVVRPSSLTGPYNNHKVKKFGLQSVLRNVLPVVPIASDNWCRQFIHEDDVIDIISMLSLKELVGDYEILNITPNTLLTGQEIAQVLGKKTVKIPVFLIKIMFFFAWHLTRGAIPTAPGSWKTYSYPIVMDGSKITKKYGYNYQYQSREAFEIDDGRYKMK